MSWQFPNSPQVCNTRQGDMFGMSISRQSSQHHYTSLSPPSPFNSHALHILHKYFSQPNDLIQACHSAHTRFPLPPAWEAGFLYYCQKLLCRGIPCIPLCVAYFAAGWKFLYITRFFSCFIFRIIFAVYFSCFFSGFSCILCSLCSFAWRTLNAWFLQFA